MTASPTRPGALLRAAGRGTVAGLAGVALMTVTEKLEQSVTGRPNSYMPGRTLKTMLTGSASPGEQSLLWNHAMHWGTGAALGALRGVWAAIGLRGPRAHLAHTAVRLATDQTLENATGMGAPPRTWPAGEEFIDIAHKALYSLTTGLVAEHLIAPSLSCRRGRTSHWQVRGDLRVSTVTTLLCRSASPELHRSRTGQLGGSGAGRGPEVQLVVALGRCSGRSPASPGSPSTRPAGSNWTAPSGSRRRCPTRSAAAEPGRAAAAHSRAHRGTRPAATAGTPTGADPPASRSRSPRPASRLAVAARSHGPVCGPPARRAAPSAVLGRAAAWPAPTSPGAALESPVAGQPVNASTRGQPGADIAAGTSGGRARRSSADMRQPSRRPRRVPGSVQRCWS